MMNFFNSTQCRQVFLFDFPWSGPVYLMGDFNDWTASPAYKMKRKKSYWFIEIKLPEGEFRYGYQVRGCLFEDPDSEYLQRSLGWPRSCVRCPIRYYCKLTTEKSNRSTALIPKNK